jgi:hypothetical protein
MKSQGVRWSLLALLLPMLALSAYAGSVNLGTASSYAALAGSTVTNTGSSVLIGNLGVSPGCAVTRSVSEGASRKEIGLNGKLRSKG